MQKTNPMLNKHETHIKCMQKHFIQSSEEIVYGKISNYYATSSPFPWEVVKLEEIGKNVVGRKVLDDEWKTMKRRLGYSMLGVFQPALLSKNYIEEKSNNILLFGFKMPMQINRKYSSRWICF